MTAPLVITETDWEEIYSETYPGEYCGGYVNEVVLFYTHERVTIEELVKDRRQYLIDNGALILNATIWRPRGEEKSRKWLVDMALGLDPQVYPESVYRPQIVWWLIPIIIGVIGGGGAILWKKVEEPIRETLAGINEIIGMVVVIMMMGMIMPMMAKQ